MAENDKFNEPTKRVVNRKELDTIIANEFIKYDKDYIIQNLTNAKIAFGVLNEINDLENHPQLNKIKCLIDEKEIELIAPPRMVINQDIKKNKIPSIGENNEAIKNEFLNMK